MPYLCQYSYKPQVDICCIIDISNMIHKTRQSSMINGFTIVELLIVIVIIAILAAITLVVYNGIQNRAHNSTVLQDVKNANNKVLQYMVDSDNVPPTADQTGLENVVKFSKGSYLSRTTDSLVYCRSNTDFGFIFISKSGQSYRSKNGAAPSTISSWGGNNTSNACSSNATVGMLIPSTDPGFATTVLYGNTTWVSWL